MKKFRFASREDANQFLLEKNFGFTSNKDANQFLFWKKKFRFKSKEDVNQFYGFWKRCDDKHILKQSKSWQQRHQEHVSTKIY